MSDLSGILGDVYGEDPDDNNNGNGAPATPPVPASPPQAAPAPAPQADAPGWADEERLDEAFADWKPGPPDSAPEAERAAFAPENDSIDDDLAAALSAALADVNEGSGNDAATPYAPGPAAAPAAPTGDDGWVTVSDDSGFGLPGAAAPPRATRPAAEPAGDWGLAPEAPLTVTPRGWSRSADDILPSGSSKPAKQPKQPKAPKEPKAEKGAAAGADAQWGPAPEAGASDADGPGAAEAPAKRRGLKLRRG